MNVESGYDSLFTIACSFIGNQSLASMTDFLRAYVHGGIITRAKPSKRTMTEDIGTGKLQAIQLASNGSASKPRD